MASYLTWMLNLLTSSKNKKTSSQARQLSAQEERFEITNKKGILNSTVTSIYFIESKEQISSHVVVTVLQRVLKRFPMMRMKIKRISQKMYFEEMDHLVPNLEVDESGDWLTCFEKHSDTQFDSESGPLWKFVLIANVHTELYDTEHFTYEYGLLMV